MGVLSLMLFSAADLKAQGSNTNGLIGKATAALNDCLVDARQQGLMIQSAVEPDGLCPDGSQKYRVVFWGKYPCPGNMVCIQVIFNVGHVEFDCHGNPVAIVCGSPTTVIE